MKLTKDNYVELAEKAIQGLTEKKDRRVKSCRMN